MRRIFHQIQGVDAFSDVSGTDFGAHAAGGINFIFGNPEKIRTVKVGRQTASRGPCGILAKACSSP